MILLSVILQQVIAAESLSEPKHIALLLPLKGPWAEQAQAIKHGFLTAFYQAQLTGSESTVTILDTSDRNIQEVYQEAVRQGANFIVGPLLKKDLSQLIKSRQITVPTLALNTLGSDAENIKNLFQFGLSPLDEAQQIVDFAWQDQHRRFIVIAPTGQWGQSIAVAFQKDWESRGGQLIEQLAYDGRTDFNIAIQHLFHLDRAAQRAKKIQGILQQKFRFIAQRRQDFDAIFLIATPAQAREIIPLLRFYYAFDVPIYAISSVYNGIMQAEHDLDGVLLVDMPWILSPDVMTQTLIDMQNNIRSIWPQTYAALTRLYSLGIDAYALIPAIYDFDRLSNFNIAGATGQLHILKNHHIYRELLYAKIQDGKPVVVSREQ